MKFSAKRICALLLVISMLSGMLVMGVSAAEIGAEIVNQQLVLEDDLTMRFFVAVDDAHKETAAINVTLAGKTDTYNTSKLTLQADDTYLVAVSLSAAQMTDAICVSVVSGGETLTQNTYTVRDYCVELITGDYSLATKQLAKQVLNYGAKAQTYFDYNVENLANAGHEAYTVYPLPQTVPEMVVDGAVAGISFYGTSLVFRSKIAVRYYFNVSGDLDSYTFKVGEQVYTPVKKGGQYYVEVPGINPQQYGAQIRLDASNGTDTLSVSYSPMNYMMRMSAKDTTSSELKALINALYGYHVEASEYLTGFAANLVPATDGNKANELTIYVQDYVSDFELGEKLNVTVKAQYNGAFTAGMSSDPHWDWVDQAAIDENGDGTYELTYQWEGTSNRDVIWFQLREGDGMHITDIVIEKQTLPEGVIAYLVPEENDNNANEINVQIAQKYPEFAQGDSVTLSATAYYTEEFQIQICGDNWERTYVTATDDDGDGIYTATASQTADNYNSQFWIILEAGSGAYITDISVTKAEEEELPEGVLAILTPDSNQLTVTVADYISDFNTTDKIDVAIQMQYSAAFSGNLSIESGGNWPWTPFEGTDADGDGTYEYTLTFTGPCDRTEFWVNASDCTIYVTGITVTKVEEPADEREPIATLTKDMDAEDGVDTATYSFRIADYFADYQSGDEVKVTIEVRSEGSINGGIAGNVTGEDGENTWTSTGLSSTGITTWECIPTYGDLCIQLWGEDDLDIMSIQIVKVVDPIATLDEDNNTYTITISDYCVDYQNGDQVKVTVWVQSEIGINGGIAGNVIGENGEPTWSSVGLNGSQGSDGLYSGTTTWECIPAYGDLCVQRWGDSLSIMSIQVEKVINVLATLTPDTDSEDGVDTATYGFKMEDYCAGYQNGDKVKITVQVQSKGGINGGIAGNVTGEDGENTWTSTGLSDTGITTWECIPTYGDLCIQLWGEDDLDIIDIQVVKVIDSIANLTPDTDSEDGVDTATYSFEMADYCADYESGDKVKVSVSVQSATGINGGIAGNVIDENGEPAWQSNGFNGADDDGDGIYTATQEWTCTPAYGSLCIQLWGSDSMDVVDIQIVSMAQPLAQMGLAEDAEGNPTGRVESFEVSLADCLPSYIKGEEITITATAKYNATFDMQLSLESADASNSWPWIAGGAKDDDGDGVYELVLTWTGVCARESVTIQLAESYLWDPETETSTPCKCDFDLMKVTVTQSVDPSANAPEGTITTLVPDNTGDGRFEFALADYDEAYVPGDTVKITINAQYPNRFVGGLSIKSNGEYPYSPFTVEEIDGVYKATYIFEGVCDDASAAIASWHNTCFYITGLTVEKVEQNKVEDVTYQAENGVLNGVEISTGVNGYTGTGYVTGFDTEGDSVRFTVSIAQEGVYDLQFIANSNGSSKGMDVYVDNVKKGSVAINTNGFAAATFEKAYMTAGEHTVSLVSGWGYIDLDALTVHQTDKVANSVYSSVADAPVNANASTVTKNLYSFLKHNYGSKSILGQHTEVNGLNGGDMQAVYNAVGSLPAMMELDLMDYSSTPIANGINKGSTIVNEAKAFAAQRGIVGISWHWQAPTAYIGSNHTWYSSFYQDHTNIDLDAIMNAYNSGDLTGYNRLMNDVDMIAAHLKALDEAGVPVIFRPLHEGNGGWFWWSKSAESYKWLYKAVYNRLVNYHGINNLIWVWNCSDAAYYPGDQYVDIISTDTHAGQSNYSTLSNEFLSLHNLGKNKMLAMSECSTMVDPDAMVKENLYWLYFNGWVGDQSPDQDGVLDGYTELTMMQKIASSSNVLLLNDLPDWQNGIFEQ